MAKSNLGQVFTSREIVNKILDEIGYNSSGIIDKKIIEPSFGEGAFLEVILERLIKECQNQDFSNEDIKEKIESNIYGLEIDKELFNKTKKLLDEKTKELGIVNINWNLYLTNSLIYDTSNKFDFVVGNPPYIRIHELDIKTRKLLENFEFCKGMSEMYAAFYELGINLLNDTGRLGYISPNSYMKNVSQRNMRNYLIKNNLVEKIIDYGSEKIFKDADTYTCITIINKNKKNKNIEYIKSLKDKILFSSIIPIKNINPLDAWNFSNAANNNLLKNINDRKIKLSQICNIQNGITTNKDSVYIGEAKKIPSLKELNNKSDKNDFIANLLLEKGFIEKNDLGEYIELKKYSGYLLFKEHIIESKILKDIIKGSKEIKLKVLFPYNKKKNCYEVMDELELHLKYPLAYEYLKDNKEILETRDMERNTKWYQFGRSQGLNNSLNKKYVFKRIFSGLTEKFSIVEYDKNTLVYSGIYITIKKEFSKYEESIKKILESEDFCNYCKIVGKDMSGGYKAVSSKQIKNYGINNTEIENFILS